MRYLLWLPLCIGLAMPVAAQSPTLLAQYPQYGQQPGQFQQQQQQYPQPGQYPQSGGQYSQPQQSAQTDPSVPGQSSLPAGEYQLMNLSTGAKIYITVTAQGQMLQHDPPAVGVNMPQSQPQMPGGYSAGYPQQGYQSQMGQGMMPGQAGQPSSYGQPSIVGSSMRGALGQYFQNKFGGGATGSYPGGGYSGYPAAGGMGNPGAMPGTTGSGAPF